MSVQIVVGAGFGDEAKGKVVDYLAQRADTILRVSGGGNAGPSVCVAGQKYKFHLLPTGLLNGAAENYITAGVMLDPIRFIDEIRALHSQKISTEKLRVSPNCHLVMPYHKLLDLREDENRYGGSIGTTGQGIGPACSDKARRVGIRVCDLMDEQVFATALRRSSEFNGPLLARFGAAKIDVAELMVMRKEWAEALGPYVENDFWRVRGAVENGQTILVEGAQGALLDMDYGFYPHVTSTHPTSAAAAIGTGLAPTEITQITLVVKAYMSRVGSGIFPTEMPEEIAGGIRIHGNEFGTTTGRPRRLGWLDLPMMRYAIAMTGATDVALTLLDVLGDLAELRICVQYRMVDKPIEFFPTEECRLELCEPVFEVLPGWKSDISQLRSFSALPKEARTYVGFIEKELGCPVSLISVGAERKQTIELPRPKTSRRVLHDLS